MHSTIIGTIAGGRTRGTGRHMADTLETPTSRLELVMGKDAVGRLANACVVVLGLGGVGSNCAEALARGGVGSLVLVDRDVVEPSNINRQAVAYTSTVGQRKTDVMARISNLTQGRVTVGPGTLYNLLESFQTTGWIMETKTEGRRRSYLITPAGEQALAEEYQRLQILSEDYRSYMGRRGEIES